MGSILHSCEPRPEILAGTFNPEIFTASLSPIIEYYRGRSGLIDNIYTNADQFFTEATYLTHGLKTVLQEVFGRLSGDNSFPAIHRLETAFGGGKTHTLIACTHIAFMGNKLKGTTADILDENLLPTPGSVNVVGVAGDELPVHKPKGKELVPYTLWGEIAYQIGEKQLYKQLESEASSFAAPGKIYFETVFGNRKVLIMLDELAQYAARLEAARPDGSSQLAAFLLALHGYARNHSCISVILTLASATDAFARQTQRLAELLSQVRGEDVSDDAALGIGERAVKGVTSVVARDATPVTPVQGAEISRILAKRLFHSVDQKQAELISGAYMDMYRKNTALLPDQATREDYKDLMNDHYPFHPTLIDFLNHKLANVENFQGTRGVLRVLSLVVRNLWLKKLPVPLIHTCHLDLREARIVNEILGRTGNSDLLPVLNADVGSVDTGKLEAGRSNAELADRRNPHPDGHPLYEYTWKTVFLHSLVDRDKGLESNSFGLTEQDALFQVAFPGLTPPQVVTALKEIPNSAYYLRLNQGRYYASPEVSINIVLARIRKTITSDQVKDLLDATARKVVKGDMGPFQLEYDVTAPEHIPDGKGKPILGLVSLYAEDIDLESFVTTKGLNRSREQQNLVFLLVAETVLIKEPAISTPGIFPQKDNRFAEARLYIEDIGRQVKAIRILKEKPQNYGIDPRMLEEEEFQRRYAEREQALVTAVSQVYNSLWYSSTSGHIVRKEIKVAGGEGGTALIQIIRKVLIDDGELLTTEHTQQSHLINLSKIFFEHSDTVALETLQNNFFCLRKWPVLESPVVFEQIIRAGVSKGVWCLFCMGSDENVRPEEFYGPEEGLPLNIDLTKPGYALVTHQGANQRGWTKSEKPDPARLQNWIKEVMAQEEIFPVDRVAEKVAEKYGEVSQPDIKEALVSLVRQERLLLYQGDADQKDKPNLISGTAAILYTPTSKDVVITPAKAAEKGWIQEKPRIFSLTSKDGARKLLPLLKRLGSLYNKGAKSTIDNLDLTDLSLPKGGTLRLSLEKVPPESMKLLGELFEVLGDIVKMDERTEGYLEISDPENDCPLIQELKK